MKYDVTYACGHTVTEDLWGPGKERAWRLEWMAAQLCPDCYRAERDKKRAERAAAVTAASEAAGLPPMIGDARKIGRAAALRVETYKMHQRVRDHAAERMQAEPEKFTAAFRADMDTCLRGFDVIFSKKTNAAFWLERENFTAKKWIQLAREIGKSEE